MPIRQNTWGLPRLSYKRGYRHCEVHFTSYQPRYTHIWTIHNTGCELITLWEPIVILRLWQTDHFASTGGGTADCVLNICSALHVGPTIFRPSRGIVYKSLTPPCQPIVFHVASLGGGLHHYGQRIKYRLHYHLRTYPPPPRINHGGPTANLRFNPNLVGEIDWAKTSDDQQSCKEGVPKSTRPKDVACGAEEA